MRSNPEEVPARETHAAVANSGERPVAADLLVEGAMAEIGVRESGGDNRGERIGQYLDSVDLPEGYAWCAAFVSFVIEDNAPGLLETTSMAKGFVQQASERGAFHESGDGMPEPGDIMVFSRSEMLGHATIVVDVVDGVIYTVEGNSGPRPNEVVTSGMNDRRQSSRVDGVRHVSYTPEQLEKMNYMGIVDIDVFAADSDVYAQRVDSIETQIVMQVDEHDGGSVRPTDNLPRIADRGNSRDEITL